MSFFVESMSLTNVMLAPTFEERISLFKEKNEQADPRIVPFYWDGLGKFYYDQNWYGSEDLTNFSMVRFKENRRIESLLGNIRVVGYDIHGNITRLIAENGDTIDSLSTSPETTESLALIKSLVPSHQSPKHVNPSVTGIELHGNHSLNYEGTISSIKKYLLGKGFINWEFYLDEDPTKFVLRYRLDGKHGSFASQLGTKLSEIADQHLYVVVGGRFLIDPILDTSKVKVWYLATEGFYATINNSNFRSTVTLGNEPDRIIQPHHNS